MDGLLESAWEAIGAWKDPNPRVRDSLERRLSELRLRNSLFMLQETQPRDRRQELADARSDVEHFSRLVKAVSTEGGKNAFLTWQCGPWTYFNPQESLPDGDGALEKIEISACIGERESAVLNLTNVCGRTLEVRITPKRFSRRGNARG